MHRIDARPPHDICDGCGTGQGYIWPTTIDGFDDYMYVERCDSCCRFESDFEAAFYLLGRLRMMSIIPITGQHRNHPFIEVDREPGTYNE